MILKVRPGSGYKVRWREHGVLRQQTVGSWDEARKLDAKKVLKPWGGQRRVPMPSRDRDMTVADYVDDRWLDWLAVARRVQPRTLSSYRQLAQLYLLPVIGRLRIRDVEGTDLDDVLHRVGHLSANTQRLIKATARVLFTRALRDLRLDMVNPCDQVDSPRGALSPDDRTRVIRARCLSYGTRSRPRRLASRSAMTPPSSPWPRAGPGRVRRSRCSGRTWTWTGAACISSGRSPGRDRPDENEGDEIRSRLGSAAGGARILASDARTDVQETSHAGADLAVPFVEDRGADVGASAQSTLPGRRARGRVASDPVAVRVAAHVRESLPGGRGTSSDGGEVARARRRPDHVYVLRARAAG
jgi:hypothetical protein